MADIIEVAKEGGLVCDNPHCDYTNETSSEQYKDWINKPCPKCGENLLTQKDYNHFMIMLKVVKVLNWIGRILRIKVKPEDMKTFSVHGHDGKITIKEE